MAKQGGRLTLFENKSETDGNAVNIRLFRSNINLQPVLLYKYFKPQPGLVVCSAGAFANF